jgi:modification methylase
VLTTTHHVLIGDARTADLPEGVALVVTSPPYPLIEMWDAPLGAMIPAAGQALARADGMAAFAAMHAALDQVWARCLALLCPGGFLCVNIGDATRTLAGRFRLYPNHARVMQGLLAAGFDPLPDILWRKPTNAPNKFMGSGMLPAGAYVTYEHEYILIARRPGVRSFRRDEDAENRRRSAYFWEERNVWFSDLWTDLRGTGQALPDKKARQCAATFPLALAHRLICMFSVYGDRVLDPFGGTGTTAAAALAAGRSSVTIEHAAGLADTIHATLQAAPAAGVALASHRLAAHQTFVAQRLAAGKTLRHHNVPHGVPVVTRQERALTLLVPGPVGAGTPLSVEHVPMV